MASRHQGRAQLSETELQMQFLRLLSRIKSASSFAEFELPISAFITFGLDWCAALSASARPPSLDYNQAKTLSLGL